MNDERLDLELGELFHAAADVQVPDGLAARVAAIPARRPARRGILGLLFGQGAEVNRPIGGGVRTRTSVPIGSLIVAALIVAGLIVVVPRVAPGVFAPISQCTLRPAATTAAPPADGPTPTQLPATPSPVGPPKPTPTAAPGAFYEVGSMTTARFGAGAILLNDGRVLTFGGNQGGSNLATAEFYDPASCSFSATNWLADKRRGYSATLLRDGRVLVTGGFDDLEVGVGMGMSSALLYDPVSATFSPTGSMTTARGGHSAVLLKDGRVLIADGIAGACCEPIRVVSAELYDPATGTFSRTATIPESLGDSVSVLLPDGRVLFVGGTGRFDNPPAPAYLYDPATGTFSPTGSMVAGWAGTATVLQDGRVLVVGRVTNLPIGTMPAWLPDAELYDSKTGTFSVTGTFDAPGSIASPLESATLLQDGRVLILGASTNGAVPHGAATTAQLYDPDTGTFAPTAPMTIARSGSAVVLLQDGRVLVAGGDGQHEYLSSAELFVP
jgi:hypothetical protein